jgi:hypothetical protein
MAKGWSKAVSFSRRARLLTRVLDWVNSGTYDDQVEYILFGRDNIYDLIDELTETEPPDTTDSEAMQRLVSDLRVHLDERLRLRELLFIHHLNSVN